MKRYLPLLGIVSALVACGGQQQPVQVTETRSITPPSVHEMSGHVCPAETSPSMSAAVMPETHPPVASYRWELPAGWQELPPTPLRAANFSITDDAAMECYLTVLTGVAGGVEANVNRWRQQMQQPPLTPEEIEALPTLDMLGKASPYIEIEGHFTGMTGHLHADYMMLAAIAPQDNATVFVKMTGPIETVKREREHFQAFCTSLEEGGANNDAAAQEDE